MKKYKTGLASRAMIFIQRFVEIRHLIENYLDKVRQTDIMTRKINNSFSVTKLG